MTRNTTDTSPTDTSPTDTSPMHHICVTRVIAASPEAIFAQLANYEGYARFPLVTRATLLRPGTPHPHGVNATREIVVGPFTFIEEITRFSPPHLIEYRVRKSFPPVDHEHGSVTIEPLDDGTRVTWKTSFRFVVPLVGATMTRAALPLMRYAIARALATIADAATTPDTASAS